MIKTLSCLVSATLGVVLLSACGSSAPLTVDKSVLSAGDNNALSTGGYWWTYTDHNALTQSGHTGATIDPATDLETPLVPKKDGDHGNVIHAAGSVPPAAPWTEVTSGLWIDQYWKERYSDSLIAAYPAAGIGFGFQKDNKPFDAVQGKYVGFVFDMKTSGNTSDVSVALPMVGTDLPDPSYNDQFIQECVYPNNQGGGTDSEAFAATYNSQSCFKNYRKLYQVADRAADGEWGTYCVLWSELVAPSWATEATLPAVGKESLAKALKVQWDMYQPADGTSAAAFDVSLDNVKMVTQETAAKVEACNADAIAASAALVGIE